MDSSIVIPVQLQRPRISVYRHMVRFSRLAYERYVDKKVAFVDNFSRVQFHDQGFLVRKGSWDEGVINSSHLCRQIRLAVGATDRVIFNLDDDGTMTVASIDGRGLFDSK